MVFSRDSLLQISTVAEVAVCKSCEQSSKSCEDSRQQAEEDSGVRKPMQAESDICCIHLQAVSKLRMSPEDVDLVIHATSTPDDLFGTGPQDPFMA